MRRFIGISSRKLGRCQVQNLSSSNSETIVSHRDLFVEDLSVIKSEWDQLVNKSPHAFMHPSASHVLSDYAKHKYEKGNYNFNVIGEFSLNVAAIHLYGSIGNFMSPRTEDSHNAIIWPDSIVLRHLSKAEIGIVMEACMTDCKLTVEDLRMKLPSRVTVHSVPSNNLVIFSATNQYSSPKSSEKVLDWFSERLRSRIMKNTCDLYLASKFEGHRSSTSVLTLPSEDSFTYISSINQVDDIVRKII